MDWVGLDWLGWEGMGWAVAVCLMKRLAKVPFLKGKVGQSESERKNKKSSQVESR